MPGYIYTDDAGHMQAERHSMANCDTVVIECHECGEIMHRRPLPVRVIWDGLAPHQESQRPQWMTNFLADTPARRDRYDQTREEWRNNKQRLEAANAAN